MFYSFTSDVSEMSKCGGMLDSLQATHHLVVEDNYISDVIFAVKNPVWVHFITAYNLRNTSLTCVAGISLTLERI